MKNNLIIFLALLLSACHLMTTEFKPATANPAAGEINANLGLAYLAQHDVVRAKQKILLAQQQAPDNPAVWYATGYFLENSQETQAAEEAYNRALELSPYLGAAHNNYGAFLCRHSQYRTAIAQFLQAVEDPNYLHAAEAYENAGHCALLIPDRDSAKRYFELAIARNPQLTSAKMSLQQLP